MRDDEDDDSFDSEAIDESDLAGDDMETVPCISCGKLIFEDAEQCPYCKTWQTEEGEEGRPRKPLWIILAAILLLAAGAMTIIWGRGFIYW